MNKDYLFKKVIENKEQVKKFLGYSGKREIPKIIDKKIEEELNKFHDYVDVEYHYTLFEENNIAYADILYTIGSRIDKIIEEYIQNSEAMRGMILDKIGIVLLDEIKDYIISEIFNNEKMYVIDEMYPSETKNFPIEKQGEIYDNIKSEKNIIINEYFQLNPVKSVAIRLVLGNKPSFVNKCNSCSTCCDGKLSDEEAFYKYFVQKSKIYTKQKYISESLLELYEDNVRDIEVWADDYFKKNKKKGIAKEHFNWIDSILDFKVIKLGSLQFEKIEDINVDLDKDNAIIINVHIREGVDFSEEALEESYKKAIDYYSKKYKFDKVIFICDSWLINNKLKKILPCESNIIKFQDKYTQVSVNDNSTQTEERVFKVFQEDKNLYQEETSLQVRLKQDLLKGEKYGMALGYRVIENF